MDRLILFHLTGLGKCNAGLLDLSPVVLMKVFNVKRHYDNSHKAVLRLHCIFRLTKDIKPFIDAEIVKKCTLTKVNLSR